MDRFRPQNPVPVLDAGGYGREPSLSLLFCHMNQDIMLKRSSDLTGSDLAAAPAANLSAEGVRPPTASALPWSVYTGPGGAIQLQHGPHAGRLLVPALSIFNTSDERYLPVGRPGGAAKLCWSTNSHDYAVIVLYCVVVDRWEYGRFPGCQQLCSRERRYMVAANLHTCIHIHHHQGQPVRDQIQTATNTRCLENTLSRTSNPPSPSLLGRLF